MDIYLSTYGDDTALGTFSEPITTIFEVLKRIESATENVNVYFMEGIYRIEHTVDLKKIKNVSFRAYNNSKVVISGAKLLQLCELEEKEKALFKGNPNLEKIKVARLTESIIQEPFGMGMPIQIGFPMVQVNGEAVKLSRFPENGFLKTKNVNGKSFCCENAEKFVFDEMLYCGYPKWEWADLVCTVKKTGNIFELERESIFGLDNDTNFYLINTAENIAENEWVISFKNGRIYYCGDAESCEFSYLTEPFFRTVDCENILFDGITFEMTRGNGVENVRGQKVRYENCTFQYISKTAAVFGCNDNTDPACKGIWGYMGNGGIDCGIENCHIYHVGMGGVYLSGGDRNGLIPCRNYAKKCHIENYSILAKTYRPGVNLMGVGCLAEGNKIHNATHMGIGFEGNEHIIEGNEIYDVLKFSDDAAAIYTGKDWTACGSIIRNNYIHDINSGIGEHGTFAIYIDDCSGSTEICGNYFEGIPCAFMLHGGRNMNVHDNIMKDCGRAFQLNRHHPDLVEENFVVLKKRFLNIEISNKAWDRYPIIRTILEDEPMSPKYNRVYNNLLINTPFGNVDKEVEENGEIDKRFYIPST